MKPQKDTIPQGKMRGRIFFFALCIVVGIIFIIVGAVSSGKALDSGTYIVGGIVIVLISLIGETIVAFRNNVLELLNKRLTGNGKDSL